MHLVPQVVAFPRPLANTGEHRDPFVDGADVADQLLNDNGLAHAGPAVGADLATLHEGCDQIEDLDPSFQDLNGLDLVVEGRRVAVDGPFLGCLHRA